MKRVVILFLLLSILVIGGCAADKVTKEVSQPEEVSEEEVIQEVDNSLVQEEDIEIGEMI